MFGYVTANIHGLSKEELLRYRSGYCGLCHTLGDRYGQAGRITLNYDMTFLILLLSSLYEPGEMPELKRCMVHPFKKHCLWQNRFTGYAADMNILLAYYNCIDDWNDDRNILARAEAGLLRRKAENIIEKYPRQSGAVKEGLAGLAEAENSRTADLDAVSGYFGMLMGELFVYDEDLWSPLLRRMAGALGRFIYMMDAYLDVGSDLRKKRYNPLAGLHGESDFSEQCRSMLEMLMSECAAEFEKLPLVQDAGLLRNILYSGVWTRYYMAQSRNESRGKGIKTDGH